MDEDGNICSWKECEECPSVEEMMRKIRNSLHEFAMTYRIESRESRKEGIDKAMETIEQLYKELHGKNQCCECNEEFDLGFSFCTECGLKIADLEKDCVVMQEVLEELKKYPMGSKCKECGYRLLNYRADKAKEVLSQVSRYPKPE